MRSVSLRLALFIILLGLAFRPRPAVADDSRPDTLAVTVVDEGGQPVAGAIVRALDESGDIPQVTTDVAGVCRIPRPLGDWPFSFHLKADDDSSARQGYLEASVRDPEQAGKPLRIVLKAARETTIRVIDAHGAAVGDALIGLRGPIACDLSHGRTNNDGSIRLRFPADAVVGAVFALKSGQGFDYWTNFAGGAGGRRKLPEALTLTLNGAQAFRIHAIDSAGKPVSGIAVYPLRILKPNRSSHIVFQEYPQLVAMLTDEHGVATFDWLPVDFKDVYLLHFEIHSKKHVVNVRRLAQLNENGAIGQEASFSLLRVTRIAGRVKGADGNPVAGIQVRAEGSRFRQSARTRADGTYEMGVRPEDAYIVSVVDDDWAAPSRDEVVVREDQPVGGIDFELIKGTVIRGTVTKNLDGRPVQNETVSLEQIGGEFPVELPKPPPSSPKRLRLSRSVLTDGEGRFQFRVGPGDYTLANENAAAARRGTSPSDKREHSRLAVTDEPEMIIDLQAEGLETGILSGTVVGPDEVPVKDAMVRGLSSIVRGADAPLNTVSDAAGEFRLERRLVPLWLIVSTPDGALARLESIEAQQDSTTIKLAPTATAIGRLIDGETAVTGGKMSIRLPLRQTARSGVPVTRLFEVGTASTAGDGRFVLSGLIVGQQYHINVGSSRELRPLKIDSPGKVDLGYMELPISSRRTPGDQGRAEHHIDLGELAGSRFGDKTGLAVRISNASADAKREHLRVVLVLGDPQSPSTQMLLQSVDRYEVDRRAVDRIGADVELIRMLADFRLMYINISDQDAAAYLAKFYQLDVAKLGLPVLVVLDEDSAVAGQQSFPLAGDPPRLDVNALRNFLKRHTLAPQDAADLMKAAARRTHDENKRILLTQTGPGSYPSRLLTRFIDQHRELLLRDYVHVNLDTSRMANGDAVIKDFRKTGTGVPWIAILDTNGNKLADSNGPMGNIGFPSEPEAIDYFIDQVLKPTVQRLTTDELEELRKALGRH